MPSEITSQLPTEVQRRWTDMQTHQPMPQSPRTQFMARPGDPIATSEITGPIWQERKTILSAALAGLIIGAVASLLLPPVYRARTSVQIQGYSSDQSTPIAATVPNASAENYLQNQVKVLESESLAKRVADRLPLTSIGADVHERPFLSSALGKLGLATLPEMTAEERRIASVKDAMNIRTSLQSQVVEIFFDSNDPVRAAQGANIARTAFIDLNREAREQLIKDTTDWLNKQAADLKASIQKANQRLQSFASSSGLILAGNEGTVAQERTRETQDALARAEADRAAKQARFETATAKGADTLADALANGPYRQYQIDLGNMRRELAQLKTLYTPTNYKVERLQAQITETERAMEDERKATIARIGSEYAAASRLEKLLTDVHARQLKTAEQEMANDRHYNALKSEIDTTQKLYESVLQKAKEAGAESALRATNIRVIDSATVPSTPYSPKPLLNMALGLGLGVFGGMAFVYVKGGSDKVRRPGEIRIFNVPELGVIPSAKDAQAIDYRSRAVARIRATNDLELIARDRRTSIVSESFRDALTSILFGVEIPECEGRPRRTGGRILVVTSLDMMEGKTTIVSNLGVVAAERKKRILLIDADLRRPRLHRIFRVPNEKGLVDALLRSYAFGAADDFLIDSFVQPTTTPGLWVLPGGRVDASSATLLHSTDFHVFLERCRPNFDLVLIDTPPLMLYSDARILGRQSDGLVMVVRANTRNRADLWDAFDKLRQDQIPVLGTILNDWRMDIDESRAYGRYRDHYQSRA